jgi:hypothetical protein
MTRTITHENIACRAEGKFACVIRTKIGPAGITKGSKSIIIGSNMKKTFTRSFKVYDFAREQVYEEGGCKKGFIPIF